MRGMKNGRYIVATALILVLGIPALAVGFGEGRNLIAGKRNPSSRALTAETEIISSNGTYSTRQSNLRNGDGGGAIYGCRSNPGSEPCIRANNLKGGRAFEFSTTGGQAGQITTGNPTGAPFVTNATGVATGLNADKVDGQDAAAFAAANRFAFAAVSAAGGLRSDVERGDRRQPCRCRAVRLHGDVQPRRQRLLGDGVGARRRERLRLRGPARLRGERQPGRGARHERAGASTCRSSADRLRGARAEARGEVPRALGLSRLSAPARAGPRRRPGRSPLTGARAAPASSG